MDHLFKANLAYFSGSRQLVRNTIKGLGYKVQILSINKHGAGDSYTIWFLVPPDKTFGKVNMDEQNSRREERPDSTE